MVPIHDTDVAENRWTQTEWQHYELWEKVEQRQKHRKWLWVGLTGFLFLILSAVPIVMNRWPKWTALAATSRLGQEINRVKREANLERQAFRIRFEGGRLVFVVEKASSCSDKNWAPVRTGSLIGGTRSDLFAILSPEQGRGLQIPGLTESFCYDYLAGSESILHGQAITGFGVIPVKDLTESRQDRLSLLLLSGPSAEISFD